MIVSCCYEMQRYDFAARKAVGSLYFNIIRTEQPPFRGIGCAKKCKKEGGDLQVSWELANFAVTKRANTRVAKWGRL